jgi:hypothetical protein
MDDTSSSLGRMMARFTSTFTHVMIKGNGY